MVNEKEIKGQIREIGTINAMSGVLRDIAASRMGDLRDQFERNVSFHEEIRDLYAVVATQARKQEIASAKRKESNSLALVITSNHKFYGGLNRRIVEYFIKEIDVYKDCIVIGETGRYHLAQSLYASKCEYMRFKEDVPDNDEMKTLIRRVEQYDIVNVYYPSYKNPFHQEPASFDINAVPDEKQVESSEQYITEPELSHLYAFFTSHVRWVLLKRVMLETDLARTAARLIKMNSAEESSSDMITDMKKEIARQRREVADIQLLESINALQQWKKLEATAR